MRLVCLECSAAYEAPDNLFGPQPREVRCNRCGYQWTVIGAQPEETTAPAVVSVGPGEAPAPVTAPMAAMPTTPAMTPQPSPRPGSSRLADTLAGARPPGETLIAREPLRPVLVVEPAAESTRTLLANSSSDETVVPPPDPEEKRLSHELDFGKSERHRRTTESVGGTRRVVLIVILLIILVGFVAVAFKTQIVAAVPALEATYAQFGL